MTPTDQVIHALERVAALPALTAAAVSEALGAPLRPDPEWVNPFYDSFFAQPEAGPFGRVELRAPAEGHAALGAITLVTLTARPDLVLGRRGLEARFGAGPPSQVLRVGVVSYTYALGPYTLHLSYRDDGARLYNAVVTTEAPR